MTIKDIIEESIFNGYSSNCSTFEEWLELAINWPKYAWKEIPEEHRTQEIELICKLG